MKILRFLILGLIIWNLPSLTLTSMGGTLGSLLSLGTIGLLVVYYFIEKKTSPNWMILIIFLLYIIISSFQFYGETKYFFNEAIKFIIFIIAGYELIKSVGTKELFIFLLIGSLSIVFQTVFFSIKAGRYSGFYLNPNLAGFVCIYGYALTYSIKNLSLKLAGQFIFTLMGLLTFSRTFIVIWILLNLISLKISIKNIRILGIGILIFSCLLFIDNVIGLDNPRFDQLTSVVNNDNVSSEELNSDSRTDTWALYYNKIADAPFFGNGYRSFAGETGVRVGVHNTYLRILGESGIIPFLLFVTYIMYLIYWSIRYFKDKPFLFMQTLALSLYLMSNHTFFDSYYLTFTAMWIQFQIVNHKKELSKDYSAVKENLITA